jgi:transcriptional regulator with XRE-family HTH domain
LKKRAESKARSVKGFRITPSGGSLPKVIGAAAGRNPSADATRPSPSRTLEESIGNRIRTLRKKSGKTVHETAHQARISISMLSKVENGATSPSLKTLHAIAGALGISLTSLFETVDRQSEASFVQAGTGLLIERRGSRAGHQYRLLGHSLSSALSVEPYLITLTDEAAPYTGFQHDGLEFIYMLSGEVGYRHADTIYLLRTGDALFFDGAALHGPEELRKLPSNFLSIIIYPNNQRRRLRSDGALPRQSRPVGLKPIDSQRSSWPTRRRPTAAPPIRTAAPIIAV